ncbi:hypothetical protein [Patulibacter defluvii]|uniref:hypothetical protein n=1 Tax=Patulibacter defluvii TaxID=3095358 RepID=UPI002A751273|nr:hypothetical protein [Patulibacter sp. DM4]
MRATTLAPILMLSLAVAEPAAAASGPLTAQTELVATLAPGKAPTPRRPRGLDVEVLMRWGQPAGGDERRTLQRAVFLFPRGTVYNGGRFPRCSIATMLARASTAGCPKGSIMGSGRADADADTSPTEARITVVNGGPTRVYFFVAMDNPAVVRTPVIGEVTKLRGRWAYRLAFDVPRELQVVGGVPIIMNQVRVRAGRGTWMAATRWPTAVSVTTTLGPAGVAR